MNKRSLKFALVAVAALGLVACNKGANSQNAAKDKEPEKPPVATVNGKPVSARTYEAWVEVITQGQRKAADLTPEQNKQALDMFLRSYLASQEAEKQGLARDPEAAAQLEVNRIQVLAGTLIQKKMKSNEPTEETLKAEYDKLAATGAFSERKVRHILVEKEALAKDIIGQLDKGGSFEALAKKYSTDGGSKPQGGDLGWLGGQDLQRMVPEFSKAVTELQKGEITKAPVQSQFGYHVIQVEDTRSVPLESVKQEITRMVQQKQLTEYLDGLKKAAKIEEKLPPPPAPAAAAPGTEPVPAPAADASPAPAAAEPPKQ